MRLSDAVFLSGGDGLAGGGGGGGSEEEGKKWTCKICVAARPPNAAVDLSSP